MKNQIEFAFKNYLSINIILIILLLFHSSCNAPMKESQIQSSDQFRFMEQNIPQIKKGYNNGDYKIKDLVQA